ncbi:MAG: hypothetical protein ACYCUZ_00995 [Cuniculiplasma sp.]
MIEGIVIGTEGVLIYTMTLSWTVGATELILIDTAIVLTPFTMYGYRPCISRKSPVKGYTNSIYWSSTFQLFLFFSFRRSGISPGLQELLSQTHYP